MLKVLAKGEIIAPDCVKAMAGIREFIGRDSGQSVGNFLQWPARREPSEIKDIYEHRQYVKEGSLWAADEATAQLCGVVFDPTFGGEYQ